jgi:arylsulfatase A-like enzyme
MTRQLPALFVVVGLILSLSPVCRPAESAQAKRSNVLFIITDQHRWDALGCAGNPIVKTPNLDRLAADGVRFTRAYSACPVCSPARTTILTGQSIGTH